MEFNFSVNALFKERIVKVKNNLLPNTHTSDRHGDGDAVSKMSSILDKMGVVSAKAQNLPHAITSAEKLRNSDHVVYFLADPNGNKGHGTVVGLLKVGRKKLFVYDKAGNQMEIEPLCVLDFYIYESQQRTGCGHYLFEHMLQDQQVGPQHLALDQPSESFLKFMNKHYALDTIMPQNNGFVVFETFFKDRTGSESIRAPKHACHNKNPVHMIKTSSRAGSEQPTFGRHSAKKAESTMGLFMYDGEHHHVNGKSQKQDPAHNGFAGDPDFQPTTPTLQDNLNGLSIGSPSKHAHPPTRHSASPPGSPQPAPTHVQKAPAPRHQAPGHQEPWHQAAPGHQAQVPSHQAPGHQAPPQKEEDLSSAGSDAEDGPQDATTPEKLDLKFYHSRLW